MVGIAFILTAILMHLMGAWEWAVITTAILGILITVGESSR
jgi:hypothetical protein